MRLKFHCPVQFVYHSYALVGCYISGLAIPGWRGTAAAVPDRGAR